MLLAVFLDRLPKLIKYNIKGTTLKLGLRHLLTVLDLCFTPDYVTVLRLSAIWYFHLFPPQHTHFGDTSKLRLNLYRRSECKFCNKITELCWSS